ncbi:GntR family transcriptional regulator [Sinomonas mesophila]|uniref:GntR family transcriptional regulator n=1 Tax=Sinomonas mesophila TaxID=1531955 RepID=UPI000987A9DB|nr:GntR family transcriptional regulator [Sinomonas mesophila]
MPLAEPSPLVASVASEIVRYVVATGQPEGARLVERTLGEHFKVSRSPVREALRILEAEGVVRKADRGGYVVARLPEAPPVQREPSTDERYYQVAADRLEGRLPDRVTENYLLRRYGFTRTELGETLRRMSAEGWIDRTPGYGWEFLPILDSLAKYRDSYRFRLVIEPAAILEPTFVLNVEALQRCREDQQRLIDGDIWDVSNAALFDSNTALHEAIMECSNNAFLSEGLRRVDRLRRLIEYKKSLPRERALVRCREHVQLIDLLLAGHNEAAAAFMREHLRSVTVEKTRETEPAGETEPAPEHGAEGPGAAISAGGTSPRR